MNVFNFFGIVIGNCGVEIFEIFNKGLDKFFILKKVEFNNYWFGFVVLFCG